MRGCEENPTWGRLQLSHSADGTTKQQDERKTTGQSRWSWKAEFDPPPSSGRARSQVSYQVARTNDRHGDGWLGWARWPRFALLVLLCPAPALCLPSCLPSISRPASAFCPSAARAIHHQPIINRINPTPRTTHAGARAAGTGPSAPSDNKPAAPNKPCQFLPIPVGRPRSELLPIRTRSRQKPPFLACGGSPSPAPAL